MEDFDGLDRAYFDLLPNEILVNIFSYIMLEDVCALSATERRLAKLVAESLKKFWNNFILRRFRGTDFQQIMRTINSFEKLRTNYSKFEGFIDNILSAMDLSDRETALSKVTESKLWRDIDIERIENGVGSELSGSALKVTIGRDLLANRFLLRWVFNNMDAHNIKKLNTRWEYQTDDDLEFVRTELKSPFLFLFINNSLLCFERNYNENNKLQILESCTSLEELNIGEASKLAIFVTDKVVPILTANCRSLKSLGAFFPITDVGIDLLTRECTALVQLKLKASKKLTDRSLACISARCKSLKSFEFTGDAETITSQAFQNFIQELPFLENLKLGSMSNVKNEVFSLIPQHCPGFQSLSLLSYERNGKNKTYQDDILKRLHNMRLKRLFIQNVRLLCEDHALPAFCAPLEELRLMNHDSKSQVALSLLFSIVKHAPNLTKICVSELTQDNEEKSWHPEQRTIVKLFALLGDSHLSKLSELNLHFGTTPEYLGVMLASESIRTLKLSSSSFTIGHIPAPKFDIDINSPNLTNCSLLLQCTEHAYESLNANSRALASLSMSAHQLLSEPIKRLLRTGFGNLKTFSGDVATPLITENHPDVLIRPFNSAFEVSPWLATPPKDLKAITGVNVFITPTRDLLQNYLPVLNFGSIVTLGLMGDVSNVLNLMTQDLYELSKAMKYLRKLRLRYVDLIELKLDSPNLEMLRLEYTSSLQLIDLACPNLVELVTDRTGDASLPLRLVNQLKTSLCPQLNTLRIVGKIKESDTQENIGNEPREFICELDSIHTLGLVSDTRIRSFHVRMPNLVTLNLHNIRHLRQIAIKECHSLTYLTVSFCKNLETFACDANNLRSLSFGFNGFLSKVKILAPKLQKLSLEYCGDYLLLIMQSILNSCVNISNLIIKKESFSPFISPNDENPIFATLEFMTKLETLTIFGQWFTPRSFNNLIARLGLIQLVKSKPKLPGESLSYLKSRKITYFEKL